MFEPLKDQYHKENQEPSSKFDIFSSLKFYTKMVRHLFKIETKFINKIYLLKNYVFFLHDLNIFYLLRVFWVFYFYQIHLSSE